MKWKPHSSGAYIFTEEGYMVTYTVTKSDRDDLGRFHDRECCYVAIHAPKGKESSSHSTILETIRGLKVDDEAGKKKARLELRAICEKHYEDSVA